MIHSYYPHPSIFCQVPVSALCYFCEFRLIIQFIDKLSWFTWRVPLVLLSILCYDFCVAFRQSHGQIAAFLPAVCRRHCKFLFSCNCVRRFFHVRSSRGQRHSGAERRLFPHTLAGGAVSLLGSPEAFKEISAIAGFVSDLSAAILAAPRLSKTHGELERAEALSNFNRARRRVRRVRGDFIAGKSHFPERKSLLCRILLIPYSIELSSLHHRILALLSPHNSLQPTADHLRTYPKYARHVERSGGIPRPRWFFTSECGMSYDFCGICHALISVCSRWCERSDSGLPRYSAYSACTSGFSWEKRSAEL